jgi:hypothetical protein
VAARRRASVRRRHLFHVDGHRRPSRRDCDLARACCRCVVL